MSNTRISSRRNHQNLRNQTLFHLFIFRHTIVDCFCSLVTNFGDFLVFLSPWNNMVVTLPWAGTATASSGADHATGKEKQQKQQARVLVSLEVNF